MKSSRVDSIILAPQTQPLRRASRRVTAQRILLAAWFCVGMMPLILQIRSYLKFMTPHKITETLVKPPGVEGETARLAVFCPVKELYIAQVRWNIEASYYHEVEHGRLCHFVVPQYNIHGNYLLGPAKTKLSSTTPASCADDSYPLEYYFYHGNIGYFAFYEEAQGTYCDKDKTAYVRVHGLGTYDINGSSLVRDTGDDGYRKSYWYSVFCGVWLLYRTIQMRRCYISCKRYARRCDFTQEPVNRKIAVVYVQENMRLTAHGATNWHRAVMLYLLVEGLMSDLFMLIAQDGIFIKLQYVSLGYNLSGVLLLVFEIIENMKWLHEKWRVFIKRLIFCYEASMLGELLSVVGLHHYITGLNRSVLKDSKVTAVTVSYYVWSLVGHGVLVLGLITFIISVRAVWAVVYVRWKHRALAVFFAPCCVDSTLALRNKMTLLGGYHWHNNKLSYTADTLKSFGLLKMEKDDGTEFVVLRKIHWVEVPTDSLYVIGTLVEDRTAYIVSHGFGTYDINGPSLVEDTGSTSYRKSYWYATTGALWVVYRGLVLRRSFIICKRYARRCSNLGVSLRRKEAVVYAHEQLRLTAHGATKLHRVALLYLLIEGLMGDLFLLIANNGLLSKIQYVSLGYNLSGLLLVAFEIIESTNWLRERTRVFIKRLLFCYESSLLGEIVGAALQQSFLTRLNGSRALKKSNHVNLAVSHYVWSIRKLLLVWLLAGVAPFVLQMRSFLKFVTPHKLTKSLIVPSGSPEETRNLVEICPVRALILSGVWWNVEPTHYYLVGSKRICHFVAPQYNTHGNYLIGATKVEPYDTTPTNCADDSYAFDQYFYHGSIGYYSFYEEQTGTYCAKDNTVYIFGNGLGSFDINGSFLAEDTGSGGYRHSFYYGLVGSIWVTYRALVLRRSFISCKRYGRRCDEVGENLNRKEAVIFVQENLRLSAHGATIYHRFALLYLLVEGIMTDLFLLIANEGILAKIQYVSLGYNLSGFLLLIYEIIEASSCMREKYRLFFKRLWFSYETAFLGELLSAALQEQMITALNRSSIFDKSKSTALAVSYYFWSLIGHGIFVLALTAFVLSCRLHIETA
ncbi:hypothetical protein PC118_g5025 [Phytophthora cactorum]|uniref:Uncharacterized protein n=1 Tax=Phytophthora cactorum TaxID=29920 RepID=A0A8T1GDE2_9STRA|nr:hypothetical protein PC118_g5025 [Phytophthora cactorum]